MQPEDVLAYAKISKNLPDNLVTFKKLEFLELLGWEQTSFCLVYTYTNGNYELWHSAESSMIYLEDQS